MPVPASPTPRLLLAFLIAAGILAVAAGAQTLATSSQTAPTLTISSPMGGSTVSGTITVSASAADNAGMSNVVFKLDGTNLASPLTSAPYQLSWNTTAVANGAHVLTAVASDATGNSATVVVPLTVSNQTGPPPPPPSGAITVTKVLEGSDTDRQSHSFAFTAPVAAGDTLVLAHVSTVDATDGTGGIVTPNGVTDSAGDTWTQAAVSHPGTSFETVEVWTARATKALPAGTAVTVRGYARGLSSEYAIFDVAGLAASNLVDQHASYAGYSRTPATPYVTTTQSHELLIAVHGQSSAAAPWWTPEASTPAWANPVDRFDGGTIGRGIAVDVRVATSAGTYRSAGTIASTATSNNLLVTLRGAG